MCPGTTVSGVCPGNVRIPDLGACNGGLGRCSRDICCPGDTLHNGEDGCQLSNASVVFVTAETASGDLNGFTGADDLCQKQADDANLAGTYSAWLSASRVSAAGRVGMMVRRPSFTAGRGHKPIGQ